MFVVKDGQDVCAGGEVLDVQRITVFCVADVAGEDVFAVEVEQGEGISLAPGVGQGDGHLLGGGVGIDVEPTALYTVWLR